MYLVRGDRRSLEHCESGVREHSLTSLACRPVLPSHITVVGGWRAPGKTVAFIVCAHPMKAIAACQLSFEVIDARQFCVRHGGLIVVAILVEPRNRVRARPAVGWLLILRD